MSYLDYTIEELHDRLVSGQVTAEELVEQAFAEIEKNDDVVQAFLVTDKEAALEKARAIDEKGIKAGDVLAGIPLAVKDNFVTTEFKTTAASKMLENFTSVFDAAAVEKLEAAGMIILGKVNMDEFAMGGTTETSYFQKTVNPWDVKRVPGGSSGGSAAAVAAGFVPVALGSDTGGSIRQPAAYTHTVGIKPTYGTVSRHGLIAFASSLDQPGPITTNVKDNALVLQALSGRDERDNTSADVSLDYTEKIGQDIKGLTIGLPKETFDPKIVDADILETIKQSVAQLEELGAEIKEISLPLLKYSVAAYYTIAPAEASSNLQRFDGQRFGYRAKDAQTLEELYVKTRTEGFGPEVKARMLLGTYFLSADQGGDYYDQAVKVRTLLRESYEEAFEEVDVILSPVSTSVAPLLAEYQAESEKQDAVDRYSADILTVPVNLAGIPSLSLPSGFVGELPVGMQLIGPAFSEPTLYQVGAAYEAANETTRQPKIVKGDE